MERSVPTANQTRLTGLLHPPISLIGRRRHHQGAEPSLPWTFPPPPAMARPPTPHDRRRSVNCTVRLTPRQHRELRQRAHDAGLTISALVRDAARLHSTPARPHIPQVNLAAVAQLRRLGNNINQLAARAHSSTYSSDLHTDVLEALEHLKRTLLGWSDTSHE